MILDTIFNSLFGTSDSAPGLFGNPTSAWDQFKNGKTNIVNKDIAEQNLQFQRENLDYQKALQERIFDREDTSYQRTVNDMRQAGLNPLAMNGTNSAGEAIPTEALHNDFQMQDKGIGTVISDLIGMMNGMQNYQVGISFGKEQEAKAKSAEAQAMVDMSTALNKISQSDLDTKTKQGLYQDFLRNMNFNKDFNIFNGMDNNSRDTRIMQAMRSQNQEKRDFATSYMMNLQEFNGLKVGGLMNMFLNELGNNASSTSEKEKKERNEIINEQLKKEVSTWLNPKKMWEETKDYYSRNYKKYGWKTWKYND